MQKQNPLKEVVECLQEVLVQRNWIYPEERLEQKKYTVFGSNSWGYLDINVFSPKQENPTAIFRFPINLTTKTINFTKSRWYNYETKRKGGYLEYTTDFE